MKYQRQMMKLRLKTVAMVTLERAVAKAAMQVAKMAAMKVARMAAKTATMEAVMKATTRLQPLQGWRGWRWRP